MKRWTLEDDKMLLENFPTEGIPGCARMLGRSEFSVKQRRDRLRRGAAHGKPATKKNIFQDMDRRRKEAVSPNPDLARAMDRYLQVREEFRARPSFAAKIEINNLIACINVGIKDNPCTMHYQGYWWRRRGDDILLLPAKSIQFALRHP